MSNVPKILISGGGTGGHVFPALAIADALQRELPSLEILFVGAKGRMEMDKVPQAGYKIKGLPVSGLQRRWSFSFITFFLKLLISLIKARSIINSFKPDVVVGVGGYASGPVLKIAQKKNIPTIIQEQNSYAGITNKLLAGKAKAICVAYSGMEKYFPAEKIRITGNPVRESILNLPQVKLSEARSFFNINEGPVLLIIGGSLGAKSINEAVLNKLETIKSNTVTLIWQTGNHDFAEAGKIVREHNLMQIKVFPFISRMDYAYKVANIIVSRAGALSISELALVGKPVILVPSPNVAEDHQTKNAEALLKLNAAILVRDHEAKGKLIDIAFELLNQPERQKKLTSNILKYGINDSAKLIVKEIVHLLK